MLEVSRDAVAAGEEQLASCAAEQNSYIFICEAILDGRWQCLAAALTQVSEAAMPPAVAAQNVGAGPFRGEACGNMLKLIALRSPTRRWRALSLAVQLFQW